jgi:hypothetical protein
MIDAHMDMKIFRSLGCEIGSIVQFSGPDKTIYQVLEIYWDEDEDEVLGMELDDLFKIETWPRHHVYYDLKIRSEKDLESQDIRIMGDTILAKVQNAIGLELENHVLVNKDVDECRRIKEGKIDELIGYLERAGISCIMEGSVFDINTNSAQRIDLVNAVNQYRDDERPDTLNLVCGRSDEGRKVKK